MVGFTILIGGEKGGTGKSTVATNLATMLTIAGKDTHLIDCDKQQTSLKFANRRATQELSPPIVSTHLAGDQLQVPLADLAKRYEAIVIDVGGQDSVELRASMITPSVQRMIIPVQAGYFDLETLVTMDNLVKTSRVYNPSLKAYCLINRAPTHTQVTVAKEAKEFISEELDHLELLETILHDRVSYSYAAAKGECVVEHEYRAKRDGKASREMCNLYKEIVEERFPEERISQTESMESNNV